MQLFTLLGMSAAEKWSTGGMTTLIGLGMTFFMLALLIGAILLLRIILKGLEKQFPILKEKFKARLSKKSPVDTEETSAETVVNAESENAIDTETMSIIEQSVRQYVASSATDGKPHTNIKIVSVKEVIND